MRFEETVRLADIARNLSEAGETNAEYVRGQVELICDATGIALAGDLLGDALTRYISHASNKPIAISLGAAILAAYEADQAVSDMQHDQGRS